MQQQGTELVGVTLAGTQAAGMWLRGFRFAGATLNGTAISNFRLVGGELMGEVNGVTKRGLDLVNAHLLADARNKDVHPPTSAVVEFKITGIVAEDAVHYDPTATGQTYLYSISQNVDGTGTWQAACPVDSDGRSAAIALADTFDESGNRNSSAPMFSLGCTTAAIAKCYRWGYRPWVTGYGNLMIMHWTCTRVVRADYCGDGQSHTQNGKLINVWDTIGAPGPIQAQGTTPPGMTFEAAWSQTGALCLSHARWNLDGSMLTMGCTNKLFPPSGNQPGKVCDNAGQAPNGNAPRMFNESAIPPP